MTTELIMDDMILIVPKAEIDLYKSDDIEMNYAKCLKQRLPSIEETEMFVIKDCYNFCGGKAFNIVIENK